MSKIKLIGLDLDGTLLNDKKELSDRNREAIEKAAAQGVIVVPATGRPLVGIKEEILSLPIKYALTANGAAIYEMESKNRIYEACFHWKEALDIISMLQEYDVLEDCFIDGQGYVEKDKFEKLDTYVLDENVKNYIRSSRILVKHLIEHIWCEGCKVEKITVNFKEENGVLLAEKEIKERFAKDFPECSVVKGIPTNLEITTGAATKGNAILKLGELLGISKEEIMVCGDSQNDMDMMKAAGFSVAMGNATPEIKAVADYVTLSNEESGVAAAIEKFVL